MKHKQIKKAERKRIALKKVVRKAMVPSISSSKKKVVLPIIKYSPPHRGYQNAHRNNSIKAQDQHA